MINYDEMSDFEINKRVVMRLPLAINEDQSMSTRPTESAIRVNDLVNSYWVDFCNNHNDSYPLMSEYGMVISVDGHAFIPRTNTRSTNKKVLRSVAICFLKMKESENE